MIITRHVCMTKDVGLNGNLFGGNMMAWLDEAAAILAEKNSSDTVVTLRVSELLFKKPVKVKDLVEIDCVINGRGKTSVTIDVRALVNEETVCECQFVFINIGEDGRPKENTFINYRK